MSNSCDPQACGLLLEHGGDEETADVRAKRGRPPARWPPTWMEFDVVLVDGGNLRLQGWRRRWRSF
jgi:hypothetical protein